MRELQSGCNSVVEFLLPKQAVAGSNPVARSIFHRQDALHTVMDV